MSPAKSEYSVERMDFSIGQVVTMGKESEDGEISHQTAPPQAMDPRLAAGPTTKLPEPEQAWDAIPNERQKTLVLSQVSYQTTPTPS